MMSELYKRDLYLTDTMSLFGTDIYEYDIHHAGMSISREYQLLPEEVLDEVEKTAKDKKEIAVLLGKLQRKDQKFKEGLAKGFVRARKEFFESNELEDCQIISIKKDAIFTTCECKHQQFGEIVFVGKHHYTSFLQIGKLEFYYDSDKDELDVKGIDDKDLEYVKDGIPNFIKKFFYKMEFEGKEATKHFIRSFSDSYKRLELDPEYYRSFDRNHNFVTWDEETMYTDIGPDLLPSINIGYNYLNIITPFLVSIL